ncbi:transposase [Gloeobacter violaceus]|uniref:Glr2130 protein n=1 Tax=Gloeobacter violaceus (strain ATCC 29082 / PCC 7421) TaxID=251221 RepID=Q7NIQ3_GLOVI|nr:transposase [Gloeobacter violaceus]BAC90071.1 glr2130 [Gloeobacter violaceus PCC 7421]
MGKPPINQMLPPFYQQFLQQQLGLDKAVFLHILLHTLQTQQNLCLERLANALPLPITVDSRRKAVQRFLLLPSLCLWHLWLPLLAQIIEHFAVQPQRLVLAIDRTNWWKYNLLMVSLVWDRRALPVFWRLLNHAGNSSLPERRSVLLPVLKYFHHKQIIVLGDREFGSVGFANWLQSQKVSYCLPASQAQ